MAGALLVVGCQNYDDQFDALESQINALASTVAGLSQVQSDLASLSATVSGLQGALQSGIDAALADGLADIDSAVADLEAATANAASAEDVAAIQEGIDANSASLEELLAQSSVFQGSVVVNTPATLDAYHAMGDGLAIINGSVDIDISADMDIAKTQELVDFILVTTGDFEYTAGTDVDTEVTFNNLSGTQSLTLDQKGGYSLQALESATVVSLDDDSTVRIVHLGALTSVTSLSDGTGAGTFTFSKGTELHLTSLPRYEGGALSLGVDEGGVIDISAFTDTTTAGKAKAFDLTIAGPTSLTISTLSGDKAGSEIIASEIANLTVNGFDGKVTLGQDVQNFTSDGLVDVAVTGDDLVSFTATGILDPNATTADTAGPALTLNAQGDLETVTLDGTYTTVTLSSNGNMTAATLGGTVTGAGGVNISSNSDLITLNVTNLTTDKLVVDGNSDLEEVTIDFTTAAGEATTQEGTITVNNNESMTSLTISTDNVDNLTISNNVDLETIDLSGMTAIGATGTASTSIGNNKLEASLADDENDAFTTTSGMETAKAYLDAVAADADSKANVTFDTVESVENASGTETGTDVADYVVLKLTPKNVTTPAETDKAHTIAFAITSDAAVQFGISSGSGNSLGNGDLLGGASATRFISLSANPTLAIAQIKEAANLTRAAAYGLSLDAFVGANPEGTITITPFANSTTADTKYEGTKAHGGVYKAYSTDVFTLTINGKSVTTSVAFNSATNSVNGGATTTLAIIDGPLMNALSNRWNAVYGNAGAASYSESLFVTSENSATISIRAKSSLSSSALSGRRGYNKAYSVTKGAMAGKGANVSTVLAFHYGATTDSSDNNTTSDDIIVVVSSANAGTILDEARHISVTGLGKGETVSKLTTTLNLNVDARTSTTNDIYPFEARGDGALGAGGDANLPEGAIAEVATAATSTDRTAWLQ